MDFYNHKDVEWADLSVSFSGANIGKLRGLVVDQDVEKEILHAAGNKGISIQVGNETITGTLKVLKQVLDDLWAAALLAGVSSPNYIEFDLVGTFKAVGSRPMKQIIIASCQFTKVGYAFNQNDKFMEIELPYLALDMKVV